MDKVVGGSCFYGQKNVRYFQEVGKKRAFLGKEHGKKEKYNADTW